MIPGGSELPGIVGGEAINESDLLGTRSNTPNLPDGPSIELATVGWDDGTQHYDLGSSTNDGNTLVKVQLFRSRDKTKPITPGVGQGTKLLAQLSSGVFRIPPPGTRVLLAFPRGLHTHLASAVIISTMESSPTIQFSATKVKQDYGANTDLVIKAKSITLSDYNNRFISITSSGVVMQDTDGSGVVIQNGKITIFSTNNTVIQLDPSNIQIFNNAGGLLKLDSSGNGTLFGKQAYVTAGTVYLGKLPVIGTFAAMLTPPATVPVASASVVISPT